MAGMRLYNHSGEIWRYSGRYAMRFYSRSGSGWHICCDGHPTPEGAKEHGLARLVELVSRVADEDIAAWAARDNEAAS